MRIELTRKLKNALSFAAHGVHELLINSKYEAKLHNYSFSQCPDYTYFFCVALHPLNEMHWLLILHRSENKPPFSRDELKLFRLLSNKFSLTFGKLLLIRQLKNSEEKYRSLAEATGDLIYGFDMDGNFRYCNNKANGYFGLTPTNYSGKNILDYIAPEDLQDALKRFEDRNNGDRSSRLFYADLYDKQKKRSSFEINSSFSKTEDGQELVIAVARNVDERKRYEGELIKRYNELKKVNQELDQFVYRVSHDLRSPLTSVLGLIYVAKDDVGKDHECGKYLEMIESSISDLDNTTRNILEYSKSNRIHPKREPIDMISVYQTSLENIRYLAGFDSVTYGSDIDSSLQFICDKISVSSIVSNLISNAFKYRRTDICAHIDFSFYVNEKEATIQVTDNGIGIEETVLPRVFEMFYRASTNATGSGLGLYIVKQYVDNLGGTIDISSIYGAGTKVTVTLPFLSTYNCACEENSEN
jgi:PAS domain S-box-containing protein